MESQTGCMRIHLADTFFFRISLGILLYTLPHEAVTFLGHTMVTQSTKNSHNSIVHACISSAQPPLPEGMILNLAVVDLWPIGSTNIWPFSVGHYDLASVSPSLGELGLWQGPVTEFTFCH